MATIRTIGPPQSTSRTLSHLLPPFVWHASCCYPSADPSSCPASKKRLDARRQLLRLQCHSHLERPYRRALGLARRAYTQQTHPAWGRITICRDSIHYHSGHLRCAIPAVSVVTHSRKRSLRHAQYNRLDILSVGQTAHELSTVRSRVLSRLGHHNGITSHRSTALCHRNVWLRLETRRGVLDTVSLPRKYHLDDDL